MEIKKAILKEHSKNNTLKIAVNIGNNKNRFAQLMQLFLKGEYRVTQRSAWVVSYCAIEYPELIKPYFKKMIKKLSEEGIHDAVKRNTVKIFAEIEIPEKYDGEIYELCFRFLRSISEPIAVKVHSMYVLEKISRKYPELRNELRETIEEIILLGVPAFTSCGRKVLKNLDKKKIRI